MKNQQDLLYEFSLPLPYQALHYNGYKFLCCVFQSGALEYFQDQMHCTPAPWPLGPRANNEDYVYMGNKDTENFYKWNDLNNFHNLKNLLGTGTRIDFGLSKQILIPVDHKWESIKNGYERQSFLDLDFYDPSNAQEITQISDKLGWCGLHLYHQGYWLVLCGRQLSTRLDSNFGFSNLDGAVLAGTGRVDDDCFYLEFRKPAGASESPSSAQSGREKQRSHNRMNRPHHP